VYLNKNSERKVETIFFREDYGRADMNEVGTIALASRPLEQYTQLFISQTAVKDIERQEFTVVIDYAYGSSLSRVLPSILGTLGCKVFVLNPYPDWKRSPKTPEDREKFATELAEVVVRQKADLGILIHSDGERLELIDELGQPLNRAKLLGMMVSMVAQTTKAGTCRVAVPLTAPSAIETILSHSGGTIVRTKTDPRFLMTVASSVAEKIVMAGDLSGGFIFPGIGEESFHPTFDGIFAFVKTLEMMALHQRRTLSSFAAELPPMHLSHRRVSCPQSENGRVMRILTEEASTWSGTVELLDGIKLIEAPNRWTLVLPDAADPFFDVHAEGNTPADANRRAQQYADRLTELVG
jgi:mannose-1-phosphate guanylyltransferase / phosphomannomutase